MPSKTKYKIGDKYNSWKVVGEAGIDSNGSRLIVVRCECGHEHKKRSTMIVGGQCKMCHKCKRAKRQNGKPKAKKAMKKTNAKCLFCDKKLKKDRKLKGYCDDTCQTRKHRQNKAIKFTKKKIEKDRQEAKNKTAMWMRKTGRCHKDGECVNYGSCLKMSFKNKCHGYESPSKISKIYEGKCHGGFTYPVGKIT